MRKRDVEKQIKSNILCKLPEGFAVSGHLLFHTPIEWFIRGYGFHYSHYEKTEFRVIAFISPLFVPDEWYYYALNCHLSEVCYSNKGWFTRFDDHKIIDCIIGYGEKWVNEIHTPSDFATKATALASQMEIVPDDMNTDRDVAYSYLLAGMHNTAVQKLGLLRAELTRRIEQRSISCWYGELLERVISLGNIIADESEAIRILRSDRERLINKLKLQQYAVDV